MTQLDAKLIQHANISEWDLGVGYISEVVIAEHGYKNHVKDLAETFGPDFRLTDAGVREWAADHVISTDYGVCNGRARIELVPISGDDKRVLRVVLPSS